MNLFTIISFEMRMILRNKFLWILLIVTSFLTNYEQFPSEKNLARLSLLNNHSYIASRSITTIGILLLFGLSFIISNRIQIDINIKDILLSKPIKKSTYICGKLLGSLFSSLIISVLFIISIMFIQLNNPTDFEILPYTKSIIYMIIPTLFFVISISISLPILIGQRTFYALFSAYILFCMVIVPNTYDIPFYFIIGDIRKLVFHNPEFTVSYLSVFMNLLFLFGLGSISLILLSIKSSKYWREQ